MFRTALIALLCTIGAACSAQQIAFTWDDLPAHSRLPPGETRLHIAQQIIAAMQHEHMPPAYGFVNGIRTQEEPGSEAVLKAWSDAGLPLGNHTWSHMNLNTATVDEFKNDTLRNEPLLQQYAAGKDWHWFRYPNLAEASGEKQQATRNFLAEHGYRIAGVTMSFSDWAFNEPYARCAAQNNTAAMQQLESTYLRFAEQVLTYTRASSKAVYGREIPYVLLMHVGALDAKMLPQLLAMYRKQGMSFITLEEAEKDPVYDSYLHPQKPMQSPGFSQAASAKQITLPPAPHLPEINLCH